MIKINKSPKLLKFIKNKNLFNNKHFFKGFLFCLLLFSLVLKSSFAQSLPPLSGEIKVSATVPDIIPPSTPILISPEDGANLDTAYPVFQWYESTDNKGMSHYQFVLDGRVWFDNIPLTSFANEDYSLHYDAGLGIYTLVANIPLNHGSHRWQIVAFDHGDNQAASTTWIFNVFTNDPNFRIQKIGDVNLRISATDPESVPTEPIRLFLNDPVANEPWIIALGDPNLRVDLTVNIPNRSSLLYRQDTDNLGKWSLQLGILPRNQIIRLDFIIVDVVGNTSYIRELYIIIYQHYWPPSPTPTSPISEIPTTTYPTPIPTMLLTPIPTMLLTPGVIGPVVTPTPPLAPPGIRVPIIPPKEIIHEVIEEVKESLPVKIATFINDLAGSPLWKALANFSALIFALLLPLVTYTMVLFKFYPYWSFKALKAVLIALWPWSSRRKNLVYEYRLSQAAPLVRIELRDAETKDLLDWQISNYLGQFFSFDWPVDRPLMLKVQDHNFYFPIGGNKPVYLAWYNFYQEEAFVIKKNILNQQAHSFDTRRALVIPTLLAQGKHDLPFFERIRIVLSYLLTYPWWFWVLSLVPVALLALRHPSIFNYLALIYYLAIALFKYFYTTGAKIWQFKALYSNGYKLNQNLILIVNDLKQGFSQASVVVMNESLSPKLHLVKNDFIFSLQAKDYAFWDGQRVLSDFEYSLEEEIISEFKLHPIESSNHNLKILQPHCQLLPQQ